MKSEYAFARLAERRRRNPVREARRQAHLTRMRNRIVAWCPTYREIPNGQVYTGHVPVYANGRYV